MSLNTAIVSALETVPGLTKKVYPAQALKNAAAPFVFYRRLRTDEEQDLNGETGLKEARYEINCVAATYAAMDDVSAQVRAALIALRGTQTEDVLLERIVCEQASPDLFETEVHLYRRLYDLQINYQEVTV